ncbi:hypothetical protein PR001_g12944 [Phytophthora rubi]|uniref:Uncharacterized protein n=1 Tax=Phytophthora rubi TaxID=129364 RepID=A0A6A3LZW0_9STRA|nr:hypothetical protein PR001_g12944 [Phytophthora rubi]
MVKTKTKRNDEDDESSGDETGARRSASDVPRNEDGELGVTGQEPALLGEATRAPSAVVDTPSAEESPASRLTHPPSNKAPSKSLSSPATEKTAEMHAITSAVYQLTTMVASLQSSAVETGIEIRNETMNKMRNETRVEMRSDTMNDERDDETAPTSPVDARGDDELGTTPMRGATADGQPFPARATPTAAVPADPGMALNAGTPMTDGANEDDLQTITTVLRGFAGQLVGLREAVNSAVTAERRRRRTGQRRRLRRGRRRRQCRQRRRCRRRRQRRLVMMTGTSDAAKGGGRKTTHHGRRRGGERTERCRTAGTEPEPSDDRSSNSDDASVAVSPRAASATSPARTTAKTAEKSDDEGTDAMDDGNGNASARRTGSDLSDSHDARAPRTLNRRRSRPHRRSRCRRGLTVSTWPCWALWSLDGAASPTSPCTSFSGTS